MLHKSNISSGPLHFKEKLEQIKCCMPNSSKLELILELN